MFFVFCLEQVVPSCSPFISFDDEKSQNSQESQNSQPQNDSQPRIRSQEVVQNKDPEYVNIKKKIILSKIPYDEKPANDNNGIQDQLGPKPPKRQPRIMENRSSLKVDFFKSDDIFG